MTDSSQQNINNDDKQDNYSDNNQQNLPLNEMAVMKEPPIDIEDTPPSGIYRRPDMQAHKTNPRIPTPVQKPGLPILNWGISAAALIITLAAGVLYMQQGTGGTPTASATQTTTIIEVTVMATIPPSVSPTEVAKPNTGVSNASDAGADANVPLDVIAETLAQPGDYVPPSDHIYRRLAAYTIAPVRNRSDVTNYTIQPGDTLDKIADRFGITTDTITWANDTIYVNRLLPGDKLTILPENGVLHKTLDGETIQSIADKYKVSPYAIIDSEYNKFQNARPETLLPPGIPVIVPGGTSEKKARYWDPGTSFKPKAAGNAGMSGGSGASSNSDGEVSFGGGPGSCGYQPTTGGGGLRVPLGVGYTVIRGFFPGHTGIDLAAPTGTTVFAAGRGTVIFAGWSNWGYGNSIVLAHGNILTLYGHLSRINVACGQLVDAGQPIGAVGTTGNSTGPHLHFEIRPNGEPVNPVGYLAF